MPLQTVATGPDCHQNHDMKAVSTLIRDFPNKSPRPMWPNHCQFMATTTVGENGTMAPDVGISAWQ